MRLAVFLVGMLILLAVSSTENDQPIPSQRERSITDMI